MDINIENNYADNNNGKTNISQTITTQQLAWNKNNNQIDQLLRTKNFSLILKHAKRHFFYL